MRYKDFVKLDKNKKEEWLFYKLNNKIYVPGKEGFHFLVTFINHFLLLAMVIILLNKFEINTEMIPYLFNVLKVTTIIACVFVAYLFMDLFNIFWLKYKERKIRGGR